MNKLNKDYETRDKILAPYREGRANFYRFENVPLKVLKELRDKNFLDVDDAQNYAPTIGELIEFMENSSSTFTAHGYAVDYDREDYRISIEGLESHDGVDFKEVEEFRQADEFTLESGYFRCWWD
jgi:hypothetical protein